MKLHQVIFKGSFIFLAAIPTLIEANSFQSIASIRLQAEEFVAQYSYDSPYAVNTELGYIDNRLKLKSCGNALNIQFTNPDKTSGRTSLSVSCRSDVNWKIHLPAKIDVYDDALVAAQGLTRGQIIDASRVVLQKVRISDLNSGYFDTSDSITDYQVKRPLKRGDVLTSRNLVPKMMVKSGQLVTLVLDYRGIQIKSSGLALRSARLGEIIKVRNLQSSRIVEGIVSGEATVRVSI